MRRAQAPWFVAARPDRRGPAADVAGLDAVGDGGELAAHERSARACDDPERGATDQQLPAP
jgi:hypothetical protein